MGVPVITLSGAIHASRVGTSLMEVLGLQENAASTADAYVARAAQLASDLPALEVLRAGLRERVAASVLTDEALFVRRLESAYREAWGRWCAAGSGGAPPPRQA